MILQSTPNFAVHGIKHLQTKAIGQFSLATTVR